MVKTTGGRSGADGPHRSRIQRQGKAPYTSIRGARGAWAPRESLACVCVCRNAVLSPSWLSEAAEWESPTNSPQTRSINGAGKRDDFGHRPMTTSGGDDTGHRACNSRNADEEEIGTGDPRAGVGGAGGGQLVEWPAGEARQRDGGPDRIRGPSGWRWGPSLREVRCRLLFKTWGGPAGTHPRRGVP